MTPLPEIDVLGPVDKAREAAAATYRTGGATTGYPPSPGGGGGGGGSTSGATAGGSSTAARVSGSIGGRISTSGTGAGGLDYRGEHPEEYGTVYTNGFEFEGFYQGMHAGKDTQSNFTGGGVVPKDFTVDPYAGRQHHNRLEQQPLPAHNDMDIGLVANMAPHRRMKP
eukprot:CAMPEP_0197594154 /NCGR_PEP_ID=MMETSP1326-20131121/19900_1 /TAXON_ID=1155430 /ORGANISM="Genus nov. species nov., Strain RCC2288" /LENGTH=167 /DNA_ID=CAMNT_0043160277 /DNA_START=1 /DNA_END=501 /DNA_ORIENTATION=-